MKKFLYPLPIAALLCVFLFNCSSDGFKEPKPSDLASWAGLDSLDINAGKNIIACIVENGQSKSCYEKISKSACDAIGGREKDQDEKCINIKFTCGWGNSEKVKYGDTAILSFAYASDSAAKIAEEENCSLKMSPLDTGKYAISSPTIAGLSPFKKDSIVAVATLTCGDQIIIQKCKQLKVDTVPGPKWTGELSFNKEELDYYANDTNAFFIDTKIDTANIETYIENTLDITNKAASECGDIEIKPYKSGTQVKVFAVVNCKYIGEYKIDSISAIVLPNPATGNCVLTGNSKAYMLDKDTLTVGVSVDNNYGRCKIEYTFSSSSGSSGYKENNSFALAGSGGKDLTNIKARVTCSGATPEVRDCPPVKVAYYKKAECTTSENREAFAIVKGSTILEFTCNKSKGDFYISCRPGPKQLPDYSQKHTYTVEIEGHSVGTTNNDIKAIVGDNGYNFPDLIQKVGDIYVYPKEIIISAEEDIKCGIW
ncbi:hypothetical protein R83H12_00294 [Fibrobacteria bacterium R8-3-H12]